MLAYLFWHSPRDPDGYEANLVAFHHALQIAAPPGCLGTATYRVRGLPWLDAEIAYEDWYLVDGFGDLEALNQTAVSPALLPAHDSVAHHAASGAGGLYEVRTGAPVLDAKRVSWLRKPDGISYADFYAALPPTSCLLRRQLALGPGLEFLAMGVLPDATLSDRERLC